MLRRYCPVSYKHVLVSDSETESDDNASSVAVVGLKKGSEKRSRIDKRNVSSKRNGKGKNLLLADDANDVARPFEAKTNVDLGEKNPYNIYLIYCLIYYFSTVYFSYNLLCDQIKI